MDKVILYSLQDDFAHGVDPSDTMTFNLYGITAFHVDFYDGSAWHTVATVAGNTLVKRAVSFTPVYASAIRVYTDASKDGQWSRIVEIEAGASSTISTTSYTYTLGDRISTMTYPSGGIVTYTRDADGRITTITWKASSSATAITLVNMATYLPFGPLNVLTFGNGRTLTKTYDTDYAIDKVVSSSASGLIVDATVDVLGNVVNASSTVGAGTPTRQYLYDPLYRLTTVQASGMPPTPVEQYAYTKTGDRTSAALNGGAATTYTYTAGTHHLSAVGATSRTYDANGNTQTAGAATFTYDARNRLTAAAGATYAYNGKGERVGKTVSGSATTFVYDEGGQLLGEYAAAGNKEYFYLDGLPVGLATTGASPQLYYIETDQLGTPRTAILPGATTSADTLVWKWDYFGSAFGTNAPSPQTLTVNLRFPGQYYDTETGLNYNYFRDYDPTTGRYVESDPIGLSGGSDTYSYTGNNPLYFTDLSGSTHWHGEFNYGFGAISKFGVTLGSFDQVSLDVVSDCVNGQRIHTVIKGWRMSGPSKQSSPMTMGILGNVELEDGAETAAAENLEGSLNFTTSGGTLNVIGSITAGNGRGHITGHGIKGNWAKLPDPRIPGINFSGTGKAILPLPEYCDCSSK